MVLIVVGKMQALLGRDGIINAVHALFMAASILSDSILQAAMMRPRNRRNA
jgi:hypothetical protein